MAGSENIFWISFVEIYKHPKELDLEIAGVCDKDTDHLEAAENFAEAKIIDL